jgi:hypothetical protein
VQRTTRFIPVQFDSRTVGQLAWHEDPSEVASQSGDDPPETFSTPQQYGALELQSLGPSQRSSSSVLEHEASQVSVGDPEEIDAQQNVPGSHLGLLPQAKSVPPPVVPEVPVVLVAPVVEVVAAALAVLVIDDDDVLVTAATAVVPPPNVPPKVVERLVPPVDPSVVVPLRVPPRVAPELVAAALTAPVDSDAEKPAPDAPPMVGIDPVDWVDPPAAAAPAEAEPDAPLKPVAAAAAKAAPVRVDPAARLPGPPPPQPMAAAARTNTASRRSLMAPVYRLPRLVRTFSRRPRELHPT